MSESPENQEASDSRPKLGCLGCLGCCFTVVVLLLLAEFLFTWLVYPGVHYIGSMPDGEPYASTEFEFRYGHATRYVSDPGNHMQWVYGGLPDSITVTSGTRLIVYNEPKAIIKSWNDSMDAQRDTFQHKGYMGIWDNGTHFLVDSEGVIQDARR